MDTDEINYRNLRKIQQTEKNSPGLTKICPDFYTALLEYIKDLEDRVQKEDSDSQKYSLLYEEMQNTKKIAMNIYEHREKKILLSAISKTRGGKPDLKNLTEEEKKLFDSTLKLMKQSRNKILNKADKEKKKKVKSENKQKDENKEDVASQKKTNPIVHITNDIPEFIGSDSKRYKLNKGDVLSLPKDMSDTLSKRKVAKKINE